MFVRTNASRHNGRLGRAISRVTPASDLRCQLPSCPSSLRSQAFTTQRRPRPWRRPPPSDYLGTGRLLDRSLATAVGEMPKLYEIPPFDPANSMIIHAPPSQSERPHAVKGGKGIPGEIDSALALFEACVRVDKLEQAALVLIRMEEKANLTAEELMSMHNRYFEASIERLKKDRDPQFAMKVHKWYEVHVKEPELPQTTDTIAYMLKISLLTAPPEEPARLGRLITRYMEMVPPDQGLDVLYRTDILTDADIAHVTHFFPQFNLPEFDDYDDAEAAEAGEATDTDIETFTDALPQPMAEDGSSIPSVLGTPQKGSGLETVKHTIGLFTHFNDGDDISKLPFAERKEFQARLERDCIDAAIERWRKTDENLRAMGLNTALGSGNMASRLWAWHQDLEKELAEQIKAIKGTEMSSSKGLNDNEFRIYGPFLMQVPPARLAATTILATLGVLTNEAGNKGVPVTTVISAVAKVVEEDINMVQRAEEKKALRRASKAEWIRRKQEAKSESTETDVPPATESSTPKLAAAEGPKKVMHWPPAVRVKIGAVLLSTLAKVAKVRVVRDCPETGEKIASMQPAFSHTIQYKTGRRVGTIIAHPSLAESMRKEPRPDLLARHLPMVVTPEPWTKFDQGAYLESRVRFIRMKGDEQDQRLYAETAFQNGHMEQIAKGLDVLGKTAWRINKPVFDVFLEAWNSGEALAKIPPLNPQFSVPEEPDATADPLVRQKWAKALKQAHNSKMSLHSQRCYMNFQLEIARAYRDQEFYYPHNMDFRGRAYPVPPYFNHMGADHVRGLLRFSKGKELGERGLMWLKVHLANVHGFDKASLKDREAFTMKHLPDIYDSVKNPLGGQRWWLEAEDAWQCLAACFELVAALDSPDPTKYKSTLPIHQDGTCNGLQHYAALGGDSWGARQVNLAPSDKPADVYSAVADLVNQAIEQDARENSRVARALQGKIKRKVVKQTVMTNVYGVTFSGAKKQVLRQLEALYPKLEDETGVESGLCASYLAVKIFNALSTMFKGAHDIQHWLGEIGGRVCRALTEEQVNQIARDLENPESDIGKTAKSKNSKVTKQDLLDACRSTIIWTTPLRLPVVQPYRKTTQKLIKTCMQTLVLNSPGRSDPVHRRKQLQAFPPNFIHSLDASHMILSALECHELGLTFAAVHDSFWTHAADIDVMNRVLRDAFIRIHSEDVIQRLLAEFEARYRGGLYLALVNRDSPAGRAIAEYRQTHKVSSAVEVATEHKRLRLLRSENAWEREQGAKMVTPASIYEQFASESGDTVSEEVPTTLGSLNEASNSKPMSVDQNSAMSSDEHDSDNGEPAEDSDMEMQPEVEGEPDAAVTDDPHAKYMRGSRFEYTFGTQGKQSEPDIKGPTTQRREPVAVWVPLSFPPVPEKGDFDVTELRNSDYFFS